MVLTTPTEKTIVAKEREEFLSIYKKHFKDIKAKKLIPELKAKLQTHALTWGHLGYIYVGNVKPFGVNHYFTELKEIAETGISAEKILRKEKAQLTEAKTKQQALVKKLKISKLYQTQFKTARGFAITKLYRRHAQLLHLYLMHHSLLPEIAKRLKLTRYQVQFMLMDEVRQALLQNKNFKPTILKRLKTCLLYTEKGFETIYLGKQAKRITKNFKKFSGKNITEFSGQTAQPGIAKGIVKIIFRAKDMKKFNKGDILVSVATDPDIVPAMKKAAAIVTEQGGITSHAAIVSRELGVPCIIGTKIATHVLKDGDMVEVNANTGVVKKIMKSQFFKSSNYIEQWGPIDMKLLYNSFWFGPMSGSVKSKWGIYWAEMVGIMKNNSGTFYWDKLGLEKEGKKAIERWLLPQTKQKQIVAEYHNLIKNLEATKKLAQALGPKTEFKKIKNLALRWHSLYYKFWSTADVFEIANYGAPVYLESEIIKYVPKNQVHSVMETLLAPEYLSFNQVSQKELLEHKTKNQSETELKKSLDRYAKKWFWLNNNYFGATTLNANYFQKKLTEISKRDAQVELKKINNYTKKVLAVKQTAVKKYHLPPKIARIASVLAYSVWLQDHRKAFAWQSSHTIEMFSKHLAHKLQIPIEDIFHYSSDEWEKAFRLQKKLSTKLLRNREKLCVMHSYKYFYTLLIGEKALKICKYFDKLYAVDKKEITKLTGIVVSKGKGKITGKVRLLLSAKESHLFKKGEILVAPMTSPDYIHAMRLASAIITDVGGLTSHAAVVSRELGIPCIVNTKIATKIFKDGDLAEVNANTGTVKLIKKN